MRCKRSGKIPLRHTEGYTVSCYSSENRTQRNEGDIASCNTQALPSIPDFISGVML